MIETNDLSKQFNDFVAVDGVNLSVGAGQILALLGQNGAGKTTTVRMLTALLQPTRGSARVAGYDVTKNGHDVRASVGVLTEHHGLYMRIRRCMARPQVDDSPERGTVPKNQGAKITILTDYNPLLLVGHFKNFPI